MALTEEWLRANLGRHTDRIRELAEHGLGVRVSRRGKIVFQMRYRINGIARRIDLGSYPTMTLHAARGENARLRHELSNGRDPKHLRATGSAETVEALFRSWYDQFCRRGKPRQLALLRLCEQCVFPKIGALAPRAVTFRDWLDVLNAATAVTPSAAFDLHKSAVKIFAWAASVKLLQTNVLARDGENRDLLRVIAEASS